MYCGLLFVCMSVGGSVSGDSKTDPGIIQEYTTLLNILHGDPLVTNPSVAYCVQLGKQKVSSEEKWSREKGAKQWSN